MLQQRSFWQGRRRATEQPAAAAPSGQAAPADRYLGAVLRGFLTMRILNVAKLATALSAVALLAACSSTPASTANTGGTGANMAQTAPVAPPPAYGPGTQQELQ